MAKRRPYQIINSLHFAAIYTKIIFDAKNSKHQKKKPNFYTEAKKKIQKNLDVFKKNSSICCDFYLRCQDFPAFVSSVYISFLEWNVRNIQRYVYKQKQLRLNNQILRNGRVHLFSKVCKEEVSAKKKKNLNEYSKRPKLWKKRKLKCMKMSVDEWAAREMWKTKSTKPKLILITFIIPRNKS